MTKYGIVFDYGEECNIREDFTGTFLELEACVARMRGNGCYNIYTEAMYNIDDTCEYAF